MGIATHLARDTVAPPACETPTRGVVQGPGGQEHPAPAAGSRNGEAVLQHREFARTVANVRGNAGAAMLPLVILALAVGGCGSHGSGPALGFPPPRHTRGVSRIRRSASAAPVPPSCTTSRSSASRSGRHTGRLVGHPEGAARASSPDRPFDPGETVEVSLPSRQRRSRSASASPSPARYRSPSSRPRPASRPGPARCRASIRRPDLRPPAVTVSTESTPHARPATSSSAPATSPARPGPMILDDQRPARLVRPAARQRPQAIDFRVQQYQGRPVLTWWQGYVPPAASARART